MNPYDSIDCGLDGGFIVLRLPVVVLSTSSVLYSGVVQYCRTCLIEICITAATAERCARTKKRAIMADSNKTEITLKGSVEIVSDFFFTSINSILYQRGKKRAI